ncbi:MAG: Rap1a/Tai family immunity protein [Pseudomonadota bacterium]|nr:Rap1a/Tai family immunity protein [Pseudomonadota bacterium]
MAKHNLIVSAALVAALNSTAVQAELTGNGLKQVCDSSELACISYVRGFIEGVGIRGLMLMGAENFRMPWCVKEQVTVQQMTLVVEKYLRDYPESLGKPGNTLTYIALGHAFPCEDGAK